MAYYGQWKPYVPVAKRRARAQKKMAALRRRGIDIQPIEIAGRKIARTFWGEAWCDHLESFSDYDNRLPRGRTYIRNGSVCHLDLKKGEIEAKVSGSEIYDVQVKIKTLSTKKWNAIKKECSGQIGSLLELLMGDLSDNIMKVVTDHKDGLFPKPAEISFSCDCPDWASMCKHVAAVLYGVGARLDQDPELLFRLRGVDHQELIDMDARVALPTATKRAGAKRLAEGDLGDVFGIDLQAETPRRTPRTSKANGKAKTSKKTKKKSAATRKKPAVSSQADSSAKKKAKAKSSATKKKSGKRTTKTGTTTKKRQSVKKKQRKTSVKKLAAAQNSAGRSSKKRRG